VKVKVIQKHNSEQGDKVPRGVVLEVRKVKYRDGLLYLKEGYQVIEDGPYLGVVLPDIKCIKADASPNYTEAEYRAIVADRDELKAKLDKALDELAEHGLTLNRLQRMHKQKRKLTAQSILVNDIAVFLHQNFRDYTNNAVNFVPIAADIAERARELLIEQSEHQ